MKFIPFQLFDKNTRKAINLSGICLYLWLLLYSLYPYLSNKNLAVNWSVTSTFVYFPFKAP
jgi:hypothetical protein